MLLESIVTGMNWASEIHGVQVYACVRVRACFLCGGRGGYIMGIELGY